MAEIGVIFLLRAAVAALATVANRIRIPYPLLLVISGLGLAFVSPDALPQYRLDPEVVFILFLPPLLFSSAYFTSWRDFSRNLHPISLLAVGLVPFTVVGVAAVAHYVAGLGWEPAFVLGAIVSPTDPLAAVVIARRLGVPRRLVVNIEGESLVNDGTALVAYRTAVAAAVGGSFDLLSASGDFVWNVVGGAIVGLLHLIPRRKAGPATVEAAR